MAERPSCDRCRRPRVVCTCRYIHPLPTRTRVLLLQHPREKRVGVGTARMAHLSLPNSILRVGLDFSADPIVRAVVASRKPVCVLFPRPGALDVSELPREQPITLVVLDGTWSLARKLLKLNPALAALPHVAFTPRRPSAYRIRRQPSEICVSTIEALAEVLGVIEPDSGPFHRLLDPFHAMVEQQQRYVIEVASHRHRHSPRAPRPSREAVLAARIAADWPRLICVQGDSNAWSRRDPARQPPEIVHWVAHRPATGDTYEAVLTPRRQLAPTTPGQIELPPERLCAGDGIDAWLRSWKAFSRPDDVVVSWGRFYDDLAAADGLGRPAHALDLRTEASRLQRVRTERDAGPRLLRSPLRTIDGFAEYLGVKPPSLGLDGRAGRRLDALVGAVGALARRDPSA